MRCAARRAGDLVLLHGCCHNPTGADLDLDQWRDVADLVSERGLIPFVDLAYQGLGNGLEADAAGTRLVVEAAEQALVAQSCDKNFGCLSRPARHPVRQGREPRAAPRSRSAICSSLARTMWSMPPDHGAAVVRIVLDDPELRADWECRARRRCARASARCARRLAAFDPRLAYIDGQNGMFSMLPLTPEAGAGAARGATASTWPGSGRFNVVGLSDESVDRFAAAVRGE